MFTYPNEKKMKVKMIRRNNKLQQLANDLNIEYKFLSVCTTNRQYICDVYPTYNARVRLPVMLESRRRKYAQT